MSKKNNGMCKISLPKTKFMIWSNTNVKKYAISKISLLKTKFKFGQKKKCQKIWNVYALSPLRQNSRFGQIQNIKKYGMCKHFLFQKTKFKFGQIIFFFKDN
jgi:hypothetical protein